MKLQILEFKRCTRDGAKIYGNLKISINESFHCWLTVLKSEKFGFFFRYPSSFIEGKFEPSFEFKKGDFQKEAYTTLKDQFKQEHG